MDGVNIFLLRDSNLRPLGLSFGNFYPIIFFVVVVVWGCFFVWRCVILVENEGEKWDCWGVGRRVV